MANVVTGDVWSIDTPGTLLATGNSVAIWSFLWTCVTAVGTSRVQVTDASGRPVFSRGQDCAGFAYTQAINMDGLSVPFLSGGILYIQMG